MELKIKYILFYCLISGCTSNPFWNDNVTSKLNISGKVIAKNKIADTPVYVWVENIDISTVADTAGNFSIDISNLASQDGSFSGSVRVFYYIHNYKIEYSTLYITDSRLSNAQTDFDQNGNLLEVVYLDRLASFDMSFSGDITDNVWDSSNGDTLNVDFRINIQDHPVSIYSNVKVLVEPHDYVPSGVLFYSSLNNELYYNQDNIDFLQRYDFDQNSFSVWEYSCTLQGLEITPGEYFVRPYFMIYQEDVPDALIQSLGIVNIEDITMNYINMPLDMVSKSIFIQ